MFKAYFKLKYKNISDALNVKQCFDTGSDVSKGGE